MTYPRQRFRAKAGLAVLVTPAVALIATILVSTPAYSRPEVIVIDGEFECPIGHQWDDGAQDCVYSGGAGGTATPPPSPGTGGGSRNPPKPTRAQCLAACEQAAESCTEAADKSEAQCVARESRAAKRICDSESNYYTWGLTRHGFSMKNLSRGENRIPKPDGSGKYYPKGYWDPYWLWFCDDGYTKDGYDSRPTGHPNCQRVNNGFSEQHCYDTWALAQLGISETESKTLGGSVVSTRRTPS